MQVSSDERRRLQMKEGAWRMAKWRNCFVYKARFTEKAMLHWTFGSFFRWKKAHGAWQNGGTVLSIILKDYTDAFALSDASWTPAQLNSPAVSKHRPTADCGQNGSCFCAVTHHRRCSGAIVKVAAKRWLTRMSLKWCWHCRWRLDGDIFFLQMITFSLSKWSWRIWLIKCGWVNSKVPSRCSVDFYLHQLPYCTATRLPWRYNGPTSTDSARRTCTHRSTCVCNSRTLNAITRHTNRPYS
jgi:hypothetical protein